MEIGKSRENAFANIKSALCSDSVGNISILMQNWSFSVMHHLLELGQSYFSLEQTVR